MQDYLLKKEKKNNIRFFQFLHFDIIRYNYKIINDVII